MDDATCSLNSCDRPHYAQGFCNAHYQRWIQTGGDPQAEIPIGSRRPTRGVCAVDGCGRPHYCNGWCEPHNHRWRKYRDVKADMPIEARNSRKGTCRVEGCDLPIKARLLCVGHGRREDKFGDVNGAAPLKRPTDGTCSVAGCPFPHEGLGWCRSHYEPYKRYRLTPDDYAALLAKQGGNCAICGQPPTLTEKLHIDHDHQCCPARTRSCGKCVRGLLCARCNTMLGHARDDEATLRSAIAYLDETRVSPALRAS